MKSMVSVCDERKVETLDLSVYFKSIVEQDLASVVVCDTEHRILHMNPAAVSNYAKWGGAGLVGKSLLDCHNEVSCRWIKKVVAWFSSDISHNRVHTFFNEKQNKDVYMVALRDEENHLIGYYEKHEYRTRDESPFYEMG